MAFMTIVPERNILEGDSYHATETADTKRLPADYSTASDSEIDEYSRATKRHRPTHCGVENPFSTISPPDKPLHALSNPITQSTLTVHTRQSVFPDDSNPWCPLGVVADPGCSSHVVTARSLDKLPERKSQSAQLKYQTRTARRAAHLKRVLACKGRASLDHGWSRMSSRMPPPPSQRYDSEWRCRGMSVPPMFGAAMSAGRNGGDSDAGMNSLSVNMAQLAVAAPRTSGDSDKRHLSVFAVGGEEEDGMECD